MNHEEMKAIVDEASRLAAAGDFYGANSVVDDLPEEAYTEELARELALAGALVPAEIVVRWFPGGRPCPPEFVLELQAAGAHLAAAAATYRLPDAACTPEFVRELVAAGSANAAIAVSKRLPKGSCTPDLAAQLASAGGYGPAAIVSDRLPEGSCTPELARELASAGARLAAMNVAERLPDGRSLGQIGGYEVKYWPGLLMVGCVIATLEQWIRDAEEIDARHNNPGLHAQTRTLAQKLLRGETDHTTQMRAIVDKAASLVAAGFSNMTGWMANRLPHASGRSGRRRYRGWPVSR